MASLKEIRNRINSVLSTRQVTSAMKLVSAAKLRKYQDSITRIKPYANKLHEILMHLGAGSDAQNETVFAEQREPKKILIIVVSSNRGLCGGFNMNVVKKAIQVLNEKYEEQNLKEQVHFMAIGKKAGELLQSKGHKVVEWHNEIFDNLEFSYVQDLASLVMERFSEKAYDRIEIVYNEFINAAVQELNATQYLPIELEPENAHGTFSTNYLYEPNQEFILKEVVPKSLKIEFYKILLDSFASEHGARMTAMHIATDNATEMIKQLRLSYNKARQATITNEIIEIVGGAEALNR